MQTREISHRFNFFAFPAPDVGGAWVAHCLELDLVAQGTDPDHAIRMLVEAMHMVATSQRQWPPFPVRQAPDEAWVAQSMAPIVGHIDVTVRYHFEGARPVLDTIAPAQPQLLAG